MPGPVTRPAPVPRTRTVSVYLRVEALPPLQNPACSVNVLFDRMPTGETCPTVPVKVYPVRVAGDAIQIEV